MRAATMSALHDVAVAAGGVTDPKQLADLVVARARIVARGDAAVLRWFESDANTFRLLASIGTQIDADEDIAADSQTLIGGAFRTGRPAIVNDYANSGQTTAWGLRQGIRAQLAVPLRVEGRPVGTLAVISSSDRVFNNADGQVLTLMAAIVAPALEAARLNQEVRRSEAMITQVYDALGVNVVVYDRLGRPIHYNSAAKAAWADALADPSGNRDHTYPTYHEDGTAMAGHERPFARAFAEKASVRGLVVGYDADSHRHWSYVDAVPVFGVSGEVESVITSTTDITRLKAAEDREHAAAERLLSLIDVQAELGHPELDEAAVLQRVVERAVELTGAAGAAVQVLEGDEVVVAAAAGFGRELLGIRFPIKGNPITGCISEGCAQSTSDAWIDPRCDQVAAHVTGIRSLVMASIKWEGQVLGGLQLQSPEPNALAGDEQTTLELLAGFAGAAISRARAATALRTSEQLFSSAFQASGIGMALTDLAGSVVQANPSLCHMLGYTEDELAASDPRQLVAPEDLDKVIGTLASLFTLSDPAVLSTEARVVHRDGHLITARVTCSMVRADGEPRHVLVHVVDTTEERKAQAILRSEQQRLQEIIEAQREIAGTELEQDRVLQALAARTARLAGTGSVAVLLPEGDQLVVRASAGTPEIPIGYAVPIDASLAGSCYRSGHVQRSDDVQNDPRADVHTAHRAGLGAAISTPLTKGGQVIGVVQLMSMQAGGLDETDVRTLEMVTGFAAAAFDRASNVQRLQSSERRTRAVVEAALDAIVIVDRRTGYIVEFSPAAEKVFGWSADDAVGRSAHVIIPDRLHEGLAKWLRDGAAAGSAEYAGRRFEATGLRADGTEFPIEIGVADLPGEAHLVAAFIRDLTLRRQFEASERRTTAVLESAPDAMVIVDRQGTIEVVNAMTELRFGYTRAELVGQSVDILLPEGLREVHRGHRTAYMEHPTALHPTAAGLVLYGRRKDASEFPIDISLSPVETERGLLIIASVRDITDRLRAEEAQRQSEAKSRLMAMMNHEVRTPLNSILGFAHLLTDQRMGDLTEKQQRYVANIQTSGNHLLSLINDSLDLAKLDAGRIDLQLSDLPAQDVMAQAAEQVGPGAQARGLTLTVQPAPDVVVRADARQLAQVLLNLLANAIRHTPAGGQITLSARNVGGGVAITVGDTGDGIAAEDLPRIFEEFFQARNHASGGIGLGLAISRRLMQMMGGSIEAESELGRGSTFTVRLARGAGSDR